MPRDTPPIQRGSERMVQAVVAWSNKQCQVCSDVDSTFREAWLVQYNLLCHGANDLISGGSPVFLVNNSSDVIHEDGPVWSHDIEQETLEQIPSLLNFQIMSARNCRQSGKPSNSPVGLGDSLRLRRHRPGVLLLQSPCAVRGGEVAVLRQKGSHGFACAFWLEGGDLDYRLCQQSPDLLGSVTWHGR